MSYSENRLKFIKLLEPQIQEKLEKIKTLNTELNDIENQFKTSLQLCFIKICENRLPYALRDESEGIKKFANKLADKIKVEMPEYSQITIDTKKLYIEVNGQKIVNRDYIDNLLSIAKTRVEKNSLYFINHPKNPVSNFFKNMTIDTFKKMLADSFGKSQDDLGRGSDIESTKEQLSYVDSYDSFINTFLETDQYTEFTKHIFSLSNILSNETISALPNVKQIESKAVHLENFTSIPMQEIMCNHKDYKVWTHYGNNHPFGFKAPVIQEKRENGYQYNLQYDEKNTAILKSGIDYSFKVSNGDMPVKLAKNGGVTFLSSGGGNLSGNYKPHAHSLHLFHDGDTYQGVIVSSWDSKGKDISSIPVYILQPNQNSFESMLRNVIDIETGKQYEFSLTPSGNIYFGSVDEYGRLIKNYSAAIQNPDDINILTFDDFYNGQENTQIVYLKSRVTNMADSRERVAAAFVLPGKNFSYK